VISHCSHGSGKEKTPANHASCNLGRGREKPVETVV